MLFLILLGAIVSSIIYINNREITTQEFLSMTGIITLVILIVYGVRLVPFPNDFYYKSGRLVKTEYHPYFVEEYEEAHTICTSCGKSTCCHTYYTTEHEKHYPYWTVRDSLGQEWEVSKNFHKVVKSDFKAHQKVTKPDKCTHSSGHIIKGDPYLYSYYNESNTYNFPTNMIEDWHNPLKNKKTIYNYGTHVKVREYPKFNLVLRSHRILVPDKTVTTKQWDILNTKVYEKVKANLVLVKIHNEEQAEDFENAWQGKKNDLVICIKGEYDKPEFVKVFGWTKFSLVKHHLESYILDNGVNLKGIEDIVIKEYEPFDLTFFDYLTTPPSFWVFVIAFIVSVVTGYFCYDVFSHNYYSKDTEDIL